MVLPGALSSMLLLMSFFDLDLNYTLRNVMLGSAILGAVGGSIGCFAVLRRESLMGDTLAHAALPGICLAFMLTGSRTSLVLMIGAAITGWLGTLCVLWIVKGGRIKQDAALGIVLSVFFGVGTVLLTHISRTGGANQSGLDRFLFGQAASIVREDVVTMAVVGAMSIGVLVVLFKEFKLICFDPQLAASLGLPVTGLTVLLTGLVVVAVVIGLQAVGVILMVAVLIAPALAARQWTNKLATMVPLAAAFGALSGVVGSVLSSQIERLPTGPTIVLVATLIVIISVLVAPERGVLWSTLRLHRQQRQFMAQQTLAELWRLTQERHERGADDAVPAVALSERLARPASFANRQLSRLFQRGLVARAGNQDSWRLTPLGMEAAAQAQRRETLWKMYLARQMDIPVSSVHVPMDEIEQLLPPDVLREFDAAIARQRTQKVGLAPPAALGAKGQV